MKASKNASGAIIGSAFVKLIGQAMNLRAEIVDFVQSIKGKN
jgi:tryptophan synthase alpha subunit